MSNFSTSLSGADFGSEHCMRCHLDGAKCSMKLASKKSNQGQTCSCCKIKKSACFFDKRTIFSLIVSSNEILEILYNLATIMTVLAGKVDSLTSEVTSLQSHVGDLCDNYHTVRPDVLTRVSNSCIAFVQSLLNLVELDHQE